MTLLYNDNFPIDADGVSATLMGLTQEHLSE